MAGTIVVDRIESDASYTSTINVANKITFSNTVNFGVFAGTAPVAGFYLPTTNNLAFTTASTERMRLNSTGALVFAGGTTTADGIGITFPATQSASTNANTLDDYEEGTWTPVIRGSSTAGTYQQTVTRALYTKVGRKVTLQCYITLASVVTGGGTGYLQITGAPFTAFSPNQFPNTVLTTDMAKSVTTLYVTATWANITIISFQENQPTTLLDFPIANAVANKTLLFTMTYFTD